MKYVKQYLATLLIALSSLSFVSTSANAELISHDLLLDGGVVGSITVDTADGFGDGFGFKEIYDFVDLTIFGRDMSAAVFDFFVIVDMFNVDAGIEFLAFDTDSVDAFAFQGVYDAFAADPAVENFLDVFDVFVDPAIPVLFGELSLGDATVVPEPHAALSFLTAGLALFVRRQRK